MHDEATSWRRRPGYYSGGTTDFESVEVLLGRFLADRGGPDPLPDFDLLAANPGFEWGAGVPLEKVVDGPEALDRLMRHPRAYRNSIAIVEPWEHVGHNPLGEPARASRNVAFLAQKVADCDSYLLPVWHTGVGDVEELAALVSAGIAVVVEGGAPSVRDARTFDGGAASLADLQRLTEQLLLSRSPTSAVALFICLGHQLSAQAHVRLLRRATDEVLALGVLPRDPNGRTLAALQRVARRIVEVGERLEVRKLGGLIAKGWDHPEFAVGPNERPEVGEERLEPYVIGDDLRERIPGELVAAHELTADEYDGVIDTTLRYERDVRIAMFHSDEVNEEAMLFANWGYRLLHDVITPVRHVVAGGALSWLLRLPDGLEILCSTSADGEVVTECSAMSVLYRDYESRRVRRSFSCQFHPELLADLRAVGDREPPSYEELKQDDGARLFARLLHEGMQE